VGGERVEGDFQAIVDFRNVLLEVLSCNLDAGVRTSSAAFWAALAMRILRIAGNFCPNVPNMLNFPTLPLKQCQTDNTGLSTSAGSSKPLCFRELPSCLNL